MGGDHVHADYLLGEHAEASSVAAGSSTRSLQTSRPSPSRPASVLSAGSSPRWRPRPQWRDAYDDPEYAQDVQRANDERLLAMLAKMAREMSEDEADDRDDELSSDVFCSSQGDAGDSELAASRSSTTVGLGVYGVSPPDDKLCFRTGESLEEARLRNEEEAMLVEVREQKEASRCLRNRLFSELQQLRDRSDRLAHESAELAGQMGSRRRDVGERLHVTSSEYQALQARLGDQRDRVQRLRNCILEGTVRWRARVDHLQHEAAEIAEQQASMSEQLEVSTHAQCRLQSELLEERATTWKQSSDLLFAFGQGEAAWSPGDATCAASVASPSGARGGSAKKGGRGEVAARTDEQLRVDRRCQVQQIAELGKEVALEEALCSQLDAQLKNFLQRTSSSSVRVSKTGLTERRYTATSTSPTWSSPSGWQDGDLIGCVCEAEALARQLGDGWVQLGRLGEQARQARGRLGADKAEASSLGDMLKRVKVVHAENAEHLLEARQASVTLRCEVRAEQAAMREAQQAVTSARQDVMHQVIMQKEVLHEQKVDVAELRTEIDRIGRGNCCGLLCGRRAYPLQNRQRAQSPMRIDTTLRSSAVASDAPAASWQPGSAGGLPWPGEPCSPLTHGLPPQQQMMLQHQHHHVQQAGGYGFPPSFVAGMHPVGSAAVSLEQRPHQWPTPTQQQPPPGWPGSSQHVGV